MQWLVTFAVATCGASPAAAALPEVALAPPVAVSPLPVMRLTGGFGESRSNHFHAGLDLSTGGVVGAAVRAPLAGTIERVRASGIGYGRSLYLRARDGRLFVFGHLDAYAPAVAAWVDSVQRASGQYEQDLWPPSGRFTFAAGETIAWSGESGAGAPHLHVEVRHGDFALSPLRAGLAVDDAGVPVLTRIVLDPVSLEARIGGVPAPRTVRPSARAETLVVEGTWRVAVEAHSGMAGAGDVPPWSLSVEWNGERTEARLDSVSWDGEMGQLDWIVDRGRIVGGGGWLLYAPAGARPRFLRSDVPLARAAGEVRVVRDDPARALRVRVTDVNGASAECTVWLRGPRRDERVAGPAPAGRAAASTLAEPRWEFFPLPGGEALRVRLTNLPGDLRSLTVTRPREADAGVAATWDGSAWQAILPTLRVPDDMGFVLEGVRADSSTWSRRADFFLWRTGDDLLFAPSAFSQLSMTRAVVWERGLVATRVRPPVAGPGLAPLTPVLQVLPPRTPLRGGAPIALRLGERDSLAGAGLYRRPPGGAWDYVKGQEWDARARLFRAETSFLGEFALLRDVSPPVVRVARPPQSATRGAYSRWTLVARVSEAGSGVDASRSRFTVDGTEVPSEWDPEEDELRWRPLVPPAPGRHRYQVTVVDRAGLRTRATGTFVLDSAAR